MKGVAADMAFLQKVTGRGGAYTSNKNDCIYCECNGDHDLNGYVTDSGRCNICVANGQEFCYHIAPLNRKEVKRKESEFVDILVKDN